jgi:hypothetical protein
MAVTQRSGAKPATTSGPGGAGVDTRATEAPGQAKDHTVKGLELLEGDIGTTLVLIGCGRRFVIQQLFGTPESQDNLVTLVGLSLLVHAIHEKAHRVHAVSAKRLSADWILGAASAREALYGLAGPGLRGTPWLGTLLLLAVAGKTAPRALFSGARGVRTSLRRMTVGFNHRYGHLVDPARGRPRPTSPPDLTAR